MDREYSAKEIAEMKKKADQAFDLKMVLKELFSALETAVTIVRWVLYVGSVAFSWFYLKEHAMAVVIAVSLTVAHGLIEFVDYIREKKARVLKEETQ